MGEGAVGAGLTVALAEAHVGQRVAFGVFGSKKRLALGAERGGIVEFMRFQRGFERPGQRRQIAVAEVQFAFGKGGFQPAVDPAI